MMAMLGKRQFLQFGVCMFNNVQYTFNVHRISRGPLPKFCLTFCLAPRIVSENNAANTVDGSGILRSPVEVGSLSHHFRDVFTSQQETQSSTGAPWTFDGSCSRKTSPIPPGILSEGFFGIMLKSPPLGGSSDFSKLLISMVIVSPLRIRLV